MSRYHRKRAFMVALIVSFVACCVTPFVSMPAHKVSGVVFALLCLVHIYRATVVPRLRRASRAAREPRDA